MRRIFNCFLSAAVLCLAVRAQQPQNPPPSAANAARAQSQPVTFEEVSPKVSGITWTHTNAHSAERYLPETVGAGGAFFDYDNDGDPDLFLANGHPDDMIETVTSRVKYKEPLLMFENVAGKYRDVSARSGAVFAKDFPARGMAAGDYDNDGDIDLLISNNGEPPALLRNEGGNRNNWVGLQLVAAKSNPGAVGAIITWQSGGARRSRLKTSGGSYLASHDPREVLGAGPAGKIDWVEIRWPSGRVDKLTGLPVNTYVRVTEGVAAAKPATAAK